MDKRSWPWRKKSLNKSSAEKSVTASDSPSQADQEIYKKPKYVQISVESYSHLTGLEDQVKTYKDQVKNLEDESNELNEKLSAADTEITNQENLVKQHAKVAEEAVEGWEKAEAEAAALKCNLETVTLLKLTAEDKIGHLDGALKECMRQIRTLKEEHEQNLQEVVLTQTEQLDRLKLEFEAKFTNLNQELMRYAAENAALSRSLQERSNMLIKISEEKSQTEAEIELLKSNVNSREREINSLKYEMHIMEKEMEIRNEEKNMSARSAEVANKQQLEGVKKIAKLEAECQRLRGLVRKRLPGPAAVAQMRLEVESLGREYGETRVRRSPGKPPSPRPQFTEFSSENIQKFNKENEFLTERLVEMEEETRILKEALAMRNTELQASRNMCAKTVNKLQSLEVQPSSQLTSPSKANLLISSEGFLTHGASSPPSFTSVSEDGKDDQESCAGSWVPALGSEKPRRSESASHLDLMDDFLEMEKLAYSSNDSNRAVLVPNQDAPKEVTNGSDSHWKEQTEADVLPNDVENTTELAVENPKLDADSSPMKKLQSRISMLLYSMLEDADVDKILDEIKRSVRKKMSVNKALSEEAVPEKEITLSEDSKPDDVASFVMNDDLVLAISQVHNFVLVLEKQATFLQGLSSNEDGLSHKIQNFSLTLDSVIQGKTSLIEFVLDLSHVLSKACELHFNSLGFKNNESETNGSDCIDKLALPENKVDRGSGDRYANGSDCFSNPDIPNEGSYIPAVESNGKCDEFEELKREKEGLVLELAKSNENFESAKARLQETEQLLAEAKSQLASTQETNGIAETQLKCMVESYKFLETRADVLQNKVNLLQAKIENLENELEEKKNNHQDTLSKCNNLEKQLQSLAAGDKTSQERELAAASEKLLECQETIFLLGKQLNSLRPPTDIPSSPFNNRALNEEPTISGMNLHEYDQSENLQGKGGESPVNTYNPLFSPSSGDINTPLRTPTNSDYAKHRPTKSSPSPNSTPEKSTRGFSHFFSSKSKNG